MRVGIIAEGKEDQEVIRYILRAYGIDGSDILFLRPSLQNDATDAADSTIGTLQGVKNACEGKDGKRPLFDNAFLFSAIDLMVVHIDTAEMEQQNFAFNKPVKTDNPNYCTQLRSMAIDLINSWLDNQYSNQLLYAIAIEEIEAWCLTIYLKTDTAQSADAKSKFWREVNKKKVKSGNSSPADFCKDFSKLKKLKTFLPYNQSLKEFADSIEVVTSTPI